MAHRTVKNSYSLLANYARALDIRTLTHSMGAVFGAKVPHSTALVPGGVTQGPTVQRIMEYRRRLGEIYDFCFNFWLPDVVTAAAEFPHLWREGRGFGHMLAYGVFEMADDSLFFPRGVIIDGKGETFNQDHIAKHLGHSWFDGNQALHPSRGETRLVNELSLAAKEQAAGVNQISEAVNALDQVTQTTAATAEETASASSSLESKSKELARLVSRFRLNDGDAVVHHSVRPTTEDFYHEESVENLEYQDAW